MIIVVGNTKKGGVGKSTIATNLAVDLDRAGKSVEILDLDPENTASFDFIVARKYSKIHCEVIETPQQLMDRDYDTNFTIIDIGGVESDLTTVAIALADKLVIPFRMSSKDLKALGSFIAWLENLYDGEAEVPDMYLVPNFAGSSSGTKQRIKNDLESLINNGYKFGTILTNRNSYMNSADTGQSVTEYGDTTAAGEIFILKENMGLMQ